MGLCKVNCRRVGKLWIQWVSRWLTAAGFFQNISLLLIQKGKKIDSGIVYLSWFSWKKNHQNKISCAKCDLMKRRNQRQILVNYGVPWYKFTYCQKLHLMLRGYIFLLLYGFFSSTYIFRAFVVFTVLRWRNLSSKLT